MSEQKFVIKVETQEGKEIIQATLSASVAGGLFSFWAGLLNPSAPAAAAPQNPLPEESIIRPRIEIAVKAAFPDHIIAKLFWTGPDRMGSDFRYSGRFEVGGEKHIFVTVFDKTGYLVFFSQNKE